MMRIRLVWFTIGFATASAAMGQFIVRDLWHHRKTLSSQLKEKFDALDARVNNLENAFQNNPNPNSD